MQFDKMTKYKVVIAESGKPDNKEKKKYILDNFKYRELGENFSRKMKKVLKKKQQLRHKTTNKSNRLGGTS